MNPIIPKKNVPYTIMAGLIALMALFAWIGVVPMRQAISGKMDDLQKFYAIRENRERQVARLPELEEQFQEIIAGEDTIRILLDEERIVDFVKTLEGLASDSGVEISIKAKESAAIIEKKPVKPQASQGGTAENAPAAADKKVKPGIMDGLPYDRYLHIGVSVKGEYVDIMDFLHKMETLPFALDVVGIDIGINSDSDERDSAVPEAGRNPFMIVPSGNVQAIQPDGEEAQSSEKPPLVADFDTVVYIRK